MKLKEAQLLGVLALIAVGIILLCMWGSDETAETSVAFDNPVDLVDPGSRAETERAQQLLDELLRPDEPVLVDRAGPQPKTVRIGIGGSSAPTSLSEAARVDKAIYSARPDDIPLTQPKPEPEPQKRTTRRTIAPAPKAMVHVVQNGETLGEISAKYYGTSRKVKEIQRANGDVDPKRLQIGMALVIPPQERTLSAVRPVASAVKPAAAVSRSQRTYVVQNGDSLYRIAQRFYNDGTRYKDILRANRHVVRDADRLTPGTELVIP